MPQAEAIVRAFLAALETRDLAQAETFLAEGVTMTFPGGVRLSSLPDLIDWARLRYTGITKSFERFDTISTADGQTVYCFGTLSGTYPNGQSFEGVRFIDRFELRGHLITRQDVWNDMGEARAHG